MGRIGGGVDASPARRARRAHRGRAAAQAAQVALDSRRRRAPVPGELGEAPFVGRLHTLRIHGRPLSIAALATWPLESLAELMLSRIGLTPGDGASLAAIRTPRLERLRLGSRPPLHRRPRGPGDRLAGGVVDVIDSPLVGELGILELPAIGLDDDGVAAIAARDWRLHTLDLSCNGLLGDTGALALAGASGLRGVHTLDLNHTAVTDTGARALLGSASLAGLERLGVVWAQMPPSDEIVEYHDWMNTVASEGRRRLTNAELRVLLGASESVTLF